MILATSVCPWSSKLAHPQYLQPKSVAPVQGLTAHIAIFHCPGGKHCVQGVEREVQIHLTLRQQKQAREAYV